MRLQAPVAHVVDAQLLAHVPLFHLPERFHLYIADKVTQLALEDNHLVAWIMLLYPHPSAQPLHLILPCWAAGADVVGIIASTLLASICHHPTAAPGLTGLCPGTVRPGEPWLFFAVPCALQRHSAVPRPLLWQLWQESCCGIVLWNCEVSSLQKTV